MYTFEVVMLGSENVIAVEKKEINRKNSRHSYLCAERSAAFGCGVAGYTRTYIKTKTTIKLLLYNSIRACSLSCRAWLLLFIIISYFIFHLC